VKTGLAFFAALVPATLWAQTPPADSLKTLHLDEVMVTATRTERALGALPMPVLLISKAQIQAMGSLRLNDVLTEQAGLVVVPQVNAQGNGIQMQGLNPDYTLILLDGEPVVGRYTGSLELSRIAVGNIKQIEIVKGPSSSLYGSDALAGVINIITERPTGNRGHAHVRYGTNNTLDLNGDVSLSAKRVGFHAFVNRYHTDGYDLSPQNFGKTVSPFTNYTFSTRTSVALTPATEWTVSTRFFRENQFFQFEVESAGNRTRTFGDGISQDWNVNQVITHRVNSNTKLIGRLYGTRYTTQTALNLESDGSFYYADDFRQTFFRPEVNIEYAPSAKHFFTGGFGHVRETVLTSRYGDSNERLQGTSYIFLQHEWAPTGNWSVITGGRFDYNTIYGNQFSPKLSMRYELSPRLALRLSSGVGFKAPDFRQVYFNFTNSAAGGYSVLGTTVAPQRLAELEAAGQISSYAFNPALLGNLQAERSFSANFGAVYQWSKRGQLDLNVFNNSINNLIESQAVAFTTSGQTIFSYRNILRAFTRGVEANATYALHQQLTLSGGYQLLFARDRDVVQDVRNGNVFWRDPETLITRRLLPREYVGLYNRSRHSGNLKLFYRHEKHGWEGTLRFIYRGRFGIGDIRGNIQGEIVPPSDRNSNAILDVYDDFVSGYWLTNLSIGKNMGHRLQLRVGIDNLFNQTEPIFIPNLPGRLAYGSVRYTIAPKKNHNQ